MYVRSKMKNNTLDISFFLIIVIDFENKHVLKLVKKKYNKENNYNKNMKVLTPTCFYKILALFIQMIIRLNSSRNMFLICPHKTTRNVHD